MLEEREWYKLFCHLKNTFGVREILAKTTSEFTAWLRWDGTSGGHLVQPPAQAELLWPTAGFPWADGLSCVSRDRDSLTPLGNLCQCLVTLTVEVFPDVPKGPPVFQFVPTVCGLSPLRRAWPCPLCPLSSIIYTHHETPPEPSLQVEQLHLSQPFLIGEMLWSPVANCLFVNCLGTTWTQVKF